MNIKSKQFRLVSTTLVAALFFVATFAIYTPQASAQSSAVLTECKKVAKKALASCPKAADQAYNMASYNCKKATKKEQCITNKAKGYIRSAAKGAKDDKTFKDNLKNKLSKLKGSDSTPYVSAYAPGATATFYGGKEGEFKCGGDDTAVVTTKIDFGCMGPDEAPEDMGPITDMAFAFIRFLSAGVGLVIVASIIFAGIQYTTSEGNPEATQAAKSRVRNSLIGLIIYIFGFSLIQFLVPGGLFAA